MASRTAASPTARPADTAMTLSEISARMASSGRVPSTLNCWALRTSVERAETAIPTQIPQPASNGVNSS